MAAILTPLLTQGGAIHDIPKKNIIIIADTDANVKRLLQVVAMFDVDTYKDANQPKVYVYALQNSKAEHTAKILQQVLLGASVGSTTAATSTVKTTTGGGAAAPAVPQPGPTGPQQTFKPSGAAGETLVAPNTKIIADEVANTLVIFASPADYAIVLGAIKQIDTIPRQVMIEVIVADLDMKDGLTLGLRWNLNVNAHKLKIDPFSNPITVGGPLGFQQLSALGAGTFGYTAVDSSGATRLQIEADATAHKAKILSAPSILVADNREARIQVGKQVPLATSTTTSPLSTGTAITNTTTSTVQYKDVGTILKVKPQINDSGLIALEMSQEISDAAPVSVLGTDQLEITKTEVTSNLVIQDGDTIVIGGLIQENDSYDNTGIPGLNKLPIIKYLFGTNTYSKERHETVILLTPRVVKSQADAKNVTSDYYELFKNVSKEMKPGKYTAPNTRPNTEKSAPAQQNNANPTGKTAEPAAGSKSGNKSSDYPLTSE